MIREVMDAIARLFTWVVLVAPWEEALRVRLGRHVRRLSAGTYLVIPFVDRIYRQSTRRRLITLNPQTLTTRDDKTIVIGGAIGFEIDDLCKLYDSLHDAEATIAATAAAAVSRYVRANRLDECTSAHVEGAVLESLDLKKFGLGGQEFYITQFAVVKTYRLISDVMRPWDPAGSVPLNTVEHVR